MSEPFIGEVRTFPYTFAPENWLSCDGQFLPISQFTTLFAVIGTIYGGDGNRTFQLPKLNNRAVMGTGTGPGLFPSSIGEPTGANSITLATSQMPSHTHSAYAEQDLSDQAAAGGAYVSIFQDSAGAGVMAYKESPTDLTSMSSELVSISGKSQAHENRQPFMGLRFCIATDGIFPPRS